MDKSSNKEYYESLKQICIYLIGEKSKAEYVLDMFYQQDVRVFASVSVIIYINYVY